MGTWLDEDAVRELRETADLTCTFAKDSRHEQISKTMPFCRHCGNPMPLPPVEKEAQGPVTWDQATEPGKTYDVVLDEFTTPIGHNPTPVEQLVTTLVDQVNTDEPPQGLSLAELKQALQEVDDDYPTKLAYEKVVSAARRVVAESESWVAYLHATFATATQGDSTS